MSFDYDEFTTRNIGFLSDEEQARLRRARVFVCGTGGMGGACALALIRMGLGRMVVADIDTFELSNLNRQVFCTLKTLGRHKAEATAAAARQINPEIEVEVLKDTWPDAAEGVIRDSAAVINGTDDLGATLLLYRTARAVGRPVIDAYAAPLPSVYVTAPGDTGHEERLGFPTIGTDWDALSEDQRTEAVLSEAEWVMTHSSSRHHLDLEVAAQVIAGSRSRMSLAPMVILTGQLMAYEALAAVLGRPHGTDNRGYFFNPYRARVEKPKPAWLAAIIRPLVRQQVRRLAG